MKLFNALFVFLLVKKQGVILFIIFNMGSVPMNACFGPLIVIFFIVVQFQGWEIFRKRLGGDKKLEFSGVVKCKGKKQK